MNKRNSHQRDSYREIPNKTKKALVRQNENNSLSPRSSQTDSSTSKSDNSSLLVDRILNAN